MSNGTRDDYSNGMLAPGADDSPVQPSDMLIRGSEHSVATDTAVFNAPQRGPPASSDYQQ